MLFPILFNISTLPKILTKYSLTASLYMFSILFKFSFSFPSKTSITTLFPIFDVNTKIDSLK